jgi:uncharacterized protein (DUF2141 family)
MFDYKLIHMKNIVIIFLALLVSSAIQTSAQTSLEVTVKNIKGAKGTIRVGLFTNENDFLKKAAEGKIVKATGTEVTVVFENLKPGDYAVSVIHDENENGELDSNLVGIPKEGFGFGNNAMGMFGPPDFQQAKVKLQATPVKQVISLNYM